MRLERLAVGVLEASRCGYVEIGHEVGDVCEHRMAFLGHAVDPQRRRLSRLRVLFDVDLLEGCGVSGRDPSARTNLVLLLVERLEDRTSPWLIVFDSWLASSDVQRLVKAA